MSASTEAAPSAVKKNYVPESAGIVLPGETNDLRKQIKRLKKTNPKKQIIIDYLG